MSMVVTPLLPVPKDKVEEKEQNYLLKISGNTYKVYKDNKELPEKPLLIANEECSNDDRNTYPTQVEFMTSENKIGTLEYKSSSIPDGNCIHKLTLQNQKTYEMRSTYFIKNPFKVVIKPHFENRTVGPSEIRQVSCYACVCSLFPSFLILGLSAVLIYVIASFVSNTYLLGVIYLAWFAVLLFFGIFYMCISTRNVMDIKVMHLLRSSNGLKFAEVYTKLRYSEIPADEFKIVAYRTLNRTQMMGLISAIIRFLHFDTDEGDEESSNRRSILIINESQKAEDNKDS